MPGYEHSARISSDQQRSKGLIFAVVYFDSVWLYVLENQKDRRTRANEYS